MSSSVHYIKTLVSFPSKKSRKISSLPFFLDISIVFGYYSYKIRIPRFLGSRLAARSTERIGVKGMEVKTLESFFMLPDARLKRA
jgi:hypothetical protein